MSEAPLSTMRCRSILDVNVRRAESYCCYWGVPGRHRNVCRLRTKPPGRFEKAPSLSLGRWGHWPAYCVTSDIRTDLFHNAGLATGETDYC